MRTSISCLVGAACLAGVAACTTAVAGPSPAVSISNVKGSPGAFVLDAKSTVKLRLSASIEGQRDGKWSDISKAFDLGAGYRLVAGCDTRASAPSRTCVELAAGASLSPVPWSGMSCSSQCNGTCDKNAPLPSGDYRLVVTTCDGSTTFTGPAFHFDGHPHDRH